MLTGIDVSHWQGVIDWATVAPQVKFALLKCTEGGQYKDHYYPINKAGCVANAVPHGAYHFFRSNVYGTTQAELFYDHASDKDMQVWVVDVETNEGGDIRGNLKAMLQKLENLTGLIPFIYTAKYFWNLNIGAQPWASRCPLWVANYGVQQPNLPAGWTSWVLWQYTAKGWIDGIQGNVDMDYFCGTPDELQALFGNGDVQPPTPPGEGLKMVVTVDALNVRSGPGTTYPIVGHLHNGEEVNAVNVGGGNAWVKIGDGKWCAVQTSGGRYMEPK